MDDPKPGKAGLGSTNNIISSSKKNQCETMDTDKESASVKDIIYSIETASRFSELSDYTDLENDNFEYLKPKKPRRNVPKREVIKRLPQFQCHRLKHTV